jgi:hypothetical protein
MSEGSPQLTPEVINGVVANSVTEERVLEELEGSSDLPSEDAIESIAEFADDYDQGDRVGEVADAVADRVATVEDVDRAVQERVDSSGDRPTFREEVQTAVDSVDGEIVGPSADEVTSAKAQEIGAPSESDFQRSRAQTVAQAETVTPSDVLDDTGAQTPVQVIEDESGEAVAATGGPSDEIGQRVADEIGAEYRSTSDVVDEFNVSGSGSSVDVTLRGRKVGEVDVR